MTNTDKLFIEQNQILIGNSIKLDDLRIHLSFSKFESLQVFLNGKDLCMSGNDTCVFVSDLENFLNQTS